MTPLSWLKTAVDESIADAAREYVAARARAAEDRFSPSSLELQLRVDRAWVVLNELCQGDTV